MKAKAAITTAPDTIIFDEVDVREPQGNEVRVKITAVGICGTDITAIHGTIGTFPAVFGHEGAGIVEAVGPDVTKFHVGDRVGITYTSCGQCKYCKAGKPSCCDQYMSNFFAPGRLKYQKHTISNWFGQNSFATTTLTTESNLTKVPAGIDPDMAGPYGCGIMTGVGSMMATDPKPGDTALVFGLGTVGMSAVMGAKLAGCEKIIVVGGTPWKLELAQELGATHVINRRETENIESAVKKISRGGATSIVEATGHSEMCVEACKCLGRLGTLYFAAVYHKPFPFLPNMSVNGTYRHGSMGDWDSVPNIEKLMQLTAEGKFPADKLIKYYDFDDIDKALDDLAYQRVIKPVLKTGN
ncbi:MAG: alcohol dehydrogenase catalytic domain-containing protein [Oscillospiraceae bacterium]|nr:alcohol dehydrogenase catalytic domain-containing protein [Oscillospiraceae bacterium]